MKTHTYITILAGVTALVASGLNAYSQDFERDGDDEYEIIYSEPLPTQTDSIVTKPFCISLTINGDPCSRIAMTWFTTPECKKGEVQIFDTKEIDATSPIRVVEANSQQTDSLQYANSGNPVSEDLKYKKVVYMSHKALVSDLAPDTQYYYRVGTEGDWSDIGSFKTAPVSEDEFSFIYITDTQASSEYGFKVSQRTVHASTGIVPDAAFILCNGDLVDSRENNASEWEYQKWFQTMQDVWQNYPLAITMGNHDINPYGNFKAHFNNNDDFNEDYQATETTAGTTYYFRRGNALFMVINYIEAYSDEYLSKVADWMRNTVADNSDCKWRIVCSHSGLFTGGKQHQNDYDARCLRRNLLSVFDELRIDLSLEGHDHVYQVIGPVSATSTSDITVLPDAVSDVEQVSEGGTIDNVTGKAGGSYNVNYGTLYFLNGRAGNKSYDPRTLEEMDAATAKHQVENYRDLFTGKLAQPGMPTFSKVTVSPSNISLSTYSVGSDGVANPYDEFVVVKPKLIKTNIMEYPDAVDDDHSGESIYTLGGIKVNKSSLSQKGCYIIRRGSESKLVIR